MKTQAGPGAVQPRAKGCQRLPDAGQGTERVLPFCHLDFGPGASRPSCCNWKPPHLGWSGLLQWQKPDGATAWESRRGWEGSSPSVQPLVGKEETGLVR